MLIDSRVVGFLLGGMVLLFDQLTKFLVFLLGKQEEIITINPFLNIVLVFNKGISFGLFQMESYLGRVILLVTIVFITLWLFFTLLRSRIGLESIALGLILGGAVGNILDRFIYGFVIDFVDLHWFSYHWPAFNIADSAIVCGAILLFLSSLCYASKR